MNQMALSRASILTPLLAVAIWAACSDTADPAPGVESISLSADSIAIQFRDSTSELTAAPKGALGVELDAEVTWQSKSTDVVTIAPNGKVARLIPVRPGTAVVEASSENITATAKVVVLDTVFSVQIAATDTLVTMGQSLTFTAAVQGPPNALRGVTWRVVDTAVARIDSLTETTNRVFVSSRDTGRTEIIATSAADRLKTARIPFRTARPMSVYFESQPGQVTSPIRANDYLIPGPLLRVRDALGNVFPGPVPVTLSISPGTGTSGAALFGRPVVTTFSGEAKFDSVGVDSAGTGYRLTATSPGLAPETSSAFIVGPECPGTNYTLGTSVTGTLTTASCRYRADQYYERFIVTSSVQQFFTIRGTQPMRGSLVFPGGERFVGGTDSVAPVVVPPGSYSIRVLSGPAALTGEFRMTTGTPNIPKGITGQIVCQLIQVVPGITFIDELRCAGANAPGDGGTHYRLHLKANTGAIVTVTSASFDPSIRVALVAVGGTLVAQDPIVPGRRSAEVVVPAEPVARNVVVSIGSQGGALSTPFTITIQAR